MRATQAATNGARARAHLLILAIAARSLSYQRVRLDLALVVEWLGRFAVPFLKRAQRAPHAATNRARVRAFVPKSPSRPCFGGRMVRPVRGAFLKRAAATNMARVRAHLLMVAVAAQNVSVRVHFFRLTPTPPVRRLELALTRAGYGARQIFVLPYRGSVPRIQRLKFLITYGFF